MLLMSQQVYIVAHVTTSIYVNSWEKYVSIVLLWYTNQKLWSWLWSFNWPVSNYNYDQAGKAIGADLINNLDLVATDPTISFKTAIWFWMTPQANKPSSHDVIIGNWRPSSSDTSAGRVPGYGVITNIINGGIECGHGYNDNVANRIGFYKRYFDILGVGYGNNLDCYNQRSFAWIALVQSKKMVSQVQYDDHINVWSWIGDFLIQWEISKLIHK